MIQPDECVVQQNYIAKVHIKQQVKGQTIDGRKLTNQEQRVGQVQAFEMSAYQKQLSQQSSAQSQNQAQTYRQLLATQTQNQQNLSNIYLPNGQPKTYAARHQSVHVSKPQQTQVIRPQSAHIQNKQTIQSSQQPYQGGQNNMHNSIQNVMLSQLSPQKQGSNHKNISKIMPMSPNQQKEDLYASALQSKVEANQLRQQNIRLQTRLQFMDVKLGQKDASGHINMLLKQLKQYKQRFTVLESQLKLTQSSVKYTQIQETKYENELYKLELTRLRNLLDSELNGRIQEVQKSTINHRDTSADRHSQESEHKLRIIRKANTDQCKKILGLNETLRAMEQNHAAEIRELSIKYQSGLQSDVKNESINVQQADTLEQLLEEANQRSAKLDSQISAQTNQYQNKIKEMIDKHLQQCKDQERVVFDVQKELECKQQNLIHLVCEHERLIDQDKQQQIRVSKLQCDIQKKESDAKELQSRIGQQESKVNELEQLRQESQQMIQILQSKLDIKIIGQNKGDVDLGKEFDLKNSEIEQLQIQINQLKPLSDKSQEIEHQNNQLRQRLQQQDTNLKSLTDGLNDEIELKQTQLQQHQFQLEQSKLSNVNLKQLTTDLQFQCQQLTLQVQELQSTIQKQKPLNKQPTQEYQKKLTNPCIDETFERDGTISVMPSDCDDNRKSIEERLPFDGEDNNEDDLDQVSVGSQQNKKVQNIDTNSDLDDAIQAVFQLNEESIHELQIMNSPSLGIALVMDAVMTLIGQPTGWPNVKQELLQNKVASVVRFDYDSCSADLLIKIQMYLKQAVFSSQKIEGQSKAAAVLSNWVKAVDKYIGDKQNQSNPIEIENSNKFNNNMQTNPKASDLNLEFIPLENSHQIKQDQMIHLKDSISQLAEHDQKSELPQSDKSVTLTPDDKQIKHCLYLLKRACQLNYVQFDKIENFIFGEEYRPEQRIELIVLAEKLISLLGLTLQEAQVFATYLVDSGQQSRTSPISPNRKVLQCRVVTVLIQNLNMYCQGVQVYSKKKEAKMKLIVGEAIQRLYDEQYTQWDQFAIDLTRVGIEKETLDCAFVYCLRICGNLSEVKEETLNDFIQDCLSDAFSHTQSKRGFPIQTELLDQTIEEIEMPPSDDEMNDRQDFLSPQNLKQPKKDNALISGSFDSGRDLDDEEDEVYEDDCEDEDQHETFQVKMPVTEIVSILNCVPEPIEYEEVYVENPCFELKHQDPPLANEIIFDQLDSSYSQDCPNESDEPEDDPVNFNEQALCTEETPKVDRQANVFMAAFEGASPLKESSNQGKTELLQPSVGTEICQRAEQNIEAVKDSYDMDEYQE